ncbi:MAG: phosphatase PAP2 family protein [Actinobacteria bacterium]|nr:phosphatase PAP2 family protein [Actinomycetota bacterium]
MTALDRSVRSWVVEHRFGLLDLLFEGFSYIGSFGIVWLVLALAISGFSWSRPWLWTRVGVAILLAESVSGALKEWVDRDRPPLADPDPEPLVRLPGTHSFPSGHATVSFACATVLALAVPRLRYPLYALAALISWSRVYVGVHYPLDVLAGAVLGIALAIALRTLAGALRRSAPGRQPG